MHDLGARTSGELFIVATPIGNMHDISHRAISTLSNVDFILAEDTRHSMHLLHSWSINKPLISLHAHNESEKCLSIIDRLLAGESCALISDAGTPLISDPGFPLVRMAQEKGITIHPIPGPCALIAALSASGIPADKFTFAGFLPAKSSARQAMLTELMNHPYTVIFYESTHRIVDCINDFSYVFGDNRIIVLAKELTKHHERFITGSPKDVLNWLLEERGREKGEFVLMLPPLPLIDDANEGESELNILLKYLPVKQAVKAAQELTGASKNNLYALALKLQSSE